MKSPSSLINVWKVSLNYLTAAFTGLKSIATSLIGFFRVPVHQLIVRWLCLSFFVPAFLYYYLGGQNYSQITIQTLLAGTIAVSAALGGLVLNAGLNIDGPKRKQTIRVATEFVLAVVFMVIFLPSLHIVEILGGVDPYSFEFGSAKAWVVGSYFWLAAISFYIGISLFILALVDLPYALIGIENAKSRNRGGADNGKSD